MQGLLRNYFFKKLIQLFFISTNVDHKSMKFDKRYAIVS